MPKALTAQTFTFSELPDESWECRGPDGELVCTMPNRLMSAIIKSVFTLAKQTMEEKQREHRSHVRTN